MNIAICYSGSWASYVRIEIFAAQQTNPGCRIFLLSDADGRIDAPDCEFFDVEALFNERLGNDKSIISRFTKYSHYRMLLPEVIHESRVLYVDADAIIDSDISEVYCSGLDGGALMAGVQDIGILPGQLKDIGLTPGDKYVNAGVTLLALDEIRASGLYDQWLSDMNTRVFSCGDQCCLNRSMQQERISLISNEYNSSLSTGFADVPKIRHWAGAADQKPWSDSSVRDYAIWRKWADMYASVH